MLAGRISNQDEDEVEDELDALEKEMNGTKLPENLPDAPTIVPEAGQAERGSARERAEARRQEQSALHAEPMLA